MTNQASSPIRSDAAHEHSFHDVVNGVELFGYPASYCKICCVWRFETPLGIFDRTPLVGYYQHAHARALSSGPPQLT